MNLFALVTPTRPAALDRHRAIVDEIAAAFIPFYDAPHERVVWSNAATLAVSFSIHAAHVPIKAYAAHDEQRCVTFNGMPLFGQQRDDPRSWAEQLLARQVAGELAPSEFGGYFNLAVVAGDTVRAYNCLSRVEPLYWIQTSDCVAVGNRATLVAALAQCTARIEYDPRAVISLCTTGWQVNDLAPVRGIQLLDNGTALEIRPGVCRLQSYKPYRFTPPRTASADDGAARELAGELRDTLLRGLRVFAGFSPELTVNLSGGKDSRIMAALCATAEIPFRCVTSGQPADREVVVAAEVAALLGAKHETTKVQVQAAAPQVDVFDLLRQHVTQSDGMTSVHDPIYSIRLKANVMLAGHGGECYRGGYDMVRTGNRPVIRDRKMALLFLRDLSLSNSTELLRDRAELQQEVINERIIDGFLESGFPWESLYDYVYTKYREGRGVANLRQAAAFGAFAFSPYLNDDALRLGWQFTLAQRRSDWLYYWLLESLDPRLARLRFSDSRWKFEQDAPRPGTSRAEWESRAPLPETPRAHAAHSWRLSYDGALRGVIRAYLLDQPYSRIFEIVDFCKLEEVLDADPPTAPGMLRSIYGILTAAYFLSDDWRKPRRSA